MRIYFSVIVVCDNISLKNRSKKNGGDITKHTMFEELREYFRPYKQYIPGEDVFIGTIVFYALFTLAFFMADHGNVECTANVINFYNSVIVFFSMALYVITNKPVCIVLATASFLASSLAELVLGTIYYPGRMFMSTYAHHIVYSALMIGTMASDLNIFSIAMMGSYIEFSAIFQSIKRIWNVKNKWFDVFNAAVFFITRIVMWIPALVVMYLLSDTLPEKGGILFMALSLILHGVWSWTQIGNLIKRYFSGTAPTSNDMSDLYLTGST